MDPPGDPLPLEGNPVEWTYPLILLGLPLGGPLFCAAGSRIGKAAPYILTAGILAATAAISLVAAWQISVRESIVLALPEASSPSLAINMDLLGTIMALLGTSLCLACTLVSKSYGALEKNDVRYLCSILLLCGALNGIFIAGDLLLMMVFWELMVVSSYILVVHSGSPSALAAGRKYFVMSQTGALLLVISVAIAFSQTGTTRMVPGSIFSSSSARLLFVALALLGFGIDAAVVPFHIWLPDAHSESPTPMSAVLSGIVVKTGLYGIIRFFYIVYEMPIDWGGIVVPLGLTTALVGGFLAVFQMDGKRLIAMSTVSQMGIIIMGLGSNTSSGAVGATYHLLNHSLFKSLLFLSAGWVMWIAGTRNLHDISQKALRSSRLLLVFYLVGLLSISGIPPFNGFFSKSVVAKSLLGAHPILAGLSTFAGMLTLLSFIKLGWYLFFREAGKEEARGKPGAMVLAVCGFLASLCLIQGILAPAMIGVIDDTLAVSLGQSTSVPSILRPSLLTALGYLGSLAALLIWFRRESVYNFFTKGALRRVGWLAGEELFIDRFFVSSARLILKCIRSVSLMASGNTRDYVAYAVIVWLAGLLLILGGVL